MNGAEQYVPKYQPSSANIPHTGQAWIAASQLHFCLYSVAKSRKRLMNSLDRVRSMSELLRAPAP